MKFKVMKVLVINSPLFINSIENYSDDSLPPLGLGYIVNELKKIKLDVIFLDAFNKNLCVTQILEHILIINPQYIILNVFSVNLLVVKEIIKQSPENIQFILGGGTQDIYKDIFNWDDIYHKIDIIVGEGEIIVPLIIQSSDSIIHNFYKVNKRVIIINNNSEYFPKDLSKYEVDHSIFENEPLFHHHGLWEAYITTNRGCIYSCAFCGSARSMNSHILVRERNIPSIRNELNTLLFNHPNIQTIRILDDLFLKDRLSVIKASQIFEGFNLSWRAMAHILSVSNLNSEEIIDLKKSGCRKLFIGIESGSQDILKMIHKVTNIGLIRKTICRLMDIGINVKGFFIVGFPNESYNDAVKTLELAIFLKKYSQNVYGNFRTSVFQFRPYAGTELYNKLMLENINYKINLDLSATIGRHQFNTSSDNYSFIDTLDLQQIIKEINDLNQC